MPTAALTTFSGWEARAGTVGEEGAALFARTTPATLGREMRYELLAVAARGFHPPRFLTASHASIAEPGTEETHEGLRLAWSLAYRQVAETRPAETAPFAIYLLGVNPPGDAADEDLAVFNDFYTNVHLPEVAERRKALRAVRFELVEVLRAPNRGAPRFLALYEVDERGAAARRHQGPPYSAGPDVWQRHTTPWRLWYRRLGDGQRE